MRKRKVLLDTDIGSDIDDAACLAYLLANPDCDLVGITTVSGEPETRARMASALCRAAGKEVPIHAGAPLPLLVEQRQTRAPQASALPRWPHQSTFAPATAIEFLRTMIRAHPGELTLLAIGPLTNVALLFRTDPEAADLLDALVLMCGSFSPACQVAYPLEWNALVDPHATSIVYRAPVRVHRSIGLDVTLEVSMSAREVRARFSSPPLLPIRDFAEVWFRENQLMTFHDPLAATTIFDPTICRFDRGTVSVGLFQNERAGRTEWSGPGRSGPHEIAVSVDADRFFSHYFSVFE